MAKKNTAKRKAAKKPGATKKKATVGKATAKKSPARKVVRKKSPAEKAAKKTMSAAQKAAKKASSARAKKKRSAANRAAHVKSQAAKEKRRVAAKKKEPAGAPKKRKTRKKASKKIATRTAGQSMRHKPETGGHEARMEILSFFGSDDLTSLTPKELQERKLTYLRAFANRGIIRDGCLAADISWGTQARWREKDTAFDDAYKHAEMLAADRLEAEAHRRAFDGYDKPVIYQGEITDTYTEYSDSLMSVLMHGYKKDKYKERREHSTPPGQPMQLEAETKDSVVSSILGMINNKPDPEP